MLHCIQSRIPSQVLLRVFCINLVKELTATDFSGYQAVLAIHAEGSIEAEKLAMVREHDSLRCKQLAKRLAGIVDAA
jgi:aromatic ring hydroxylase